MPRIALIILLSIIVISLVALGTVAIMSMPNQAATPPANPPTNPITAPTVVSTPQLAPCALNCGSQSVLEMAKKYYNGLGQWKGVYTMDPVRAVQVDANHCDIEYKYTPIGTTGEAGSDKRRFTFQKTSDACDWTVSDMGSYHSGTSL